MSDSSQKENQLETVNSTSIISFEFEDETSNEQKDLREEHKSEKNINVHHDNECEPDKLVVKTSQKQDTCDTIRMNIDDEITAMPHTNDFLDMKNVSSGKKFEYNSIKAKRKFWFRSWRKHPKSKSKEFQDFKNPPKTIFMVHTAEPSGPTLDYDPSRNTFVLFTFSVCGVMLLFSVIVIGILINTQSFRDFSKTLEGIILSLVSIIVCVLISYIYWCSRCSRILAIGIILNTITTFCYTFFAAVVASRYAPYIVLGAGCTTVVIIIFCVGLAMTSFDFTKFILIVMVAGLALMVGSLMALAITKIFGIDLGPIRIILLIISSVVTCVTIIIELQMILGGKSVELSEDEFMLGAFLVYMSVMDLFLKMLQLLNEIMDDDD